jgi:AraC family ethanolamine operon transcriptional activator
MNAAAPDDAPAAAVCGHWQLRDACRQAALQDWLELECHQMDAGPFAGALSRLDVGRLHVVEEHQDRTVYKLGLMPADRCTVSILIDPRPRARFMQHVSEHWREVFLLPGGVDFDLLVPGGTSTLYVSLDEAALLARARALDPRRWEARPDRLLSLGVAGRARFVRAVDAVQRLGLDGGIENVEQVERLLSDEILMAMTADEPLRIDDDAQPPPRRRRLRILRAAQDYITDSLESGVTPCIADICSHVGAAERTLQYCFRDLLGLAPVGYLRTLRLNHVHAELLAPTTADATVTRAAARYGFLHAGHFSRDYRHHFGETPSATLARATT